MSRKLRKTGKRVFTTAAKLGRKSGLKRAIRKGSRALGERVIGPANRWYTTLQGRRSNSVLANPFTTVILPVELIRFRTTLSHSKLREQRTHIAGIKLRRRMVGAVLSGDWDLERKPFSEGTSSLRAFEERFIEDKDWEETIYYTVFHGKDGPFKGCDTWQEFKQRQLQRWEEIFREMQARGYKSQAELGNPPEEEVEVCVGRNGEIIEVIGNHRVAMATILDIPEIPVIVNVWHKRYIEHVEKQLDTAILTPTEAIRPVLEQAGG